MKKLNLLFLLVITLTCMASCQKESSNSNYSLTFYSDGLALVSKYNDEHELKYGFIDKDGNEVIQCIYDDAEGFNNGLAIVSLNNNYYLINTEGEIKSSIVFDELKYDYNYKVYYGLADNNSYLLNDGGDILTTFNGAIEEFSENLCVVQDNNKFSFIDLGGNKVSDFIYDTATSFTNGRSIVSENGNYYIVDKALNIIFDAGNKRIEKCTNNFIYLSYGKYVDGIYCHFDELVNYNNKKIMDVNDNIRFGVMDNYIIIDNNIYNKKAELFLKNFYECENLGEYLLVRKDKYSASLYDENLNLVDELKFEEEVSIIVDAYDKYREKYYIKIYSSNFQRIYLIDNNKLNRKKFLEKYDNIDDIYKDYISVEIDDKYGLISLKGNVKITPNNKRKYVFTDDGYIVFKNDNGENIVMNKNEKVLIKSKDYLYFCFKSS